MPQPEILNVEPREAVEFFRSKGYHVAFSWKDTEALEHVGSFTVAKVVEMDMLREIRAAADRAVSQGITFEAFRDELEPFLRRRGWVGADNSSSTRSPAASSTTPANTWTDDDEDGNSRTYMESLERSRGMKCGTVCN